MAVCGYRACTEPTHVGSSSPFQSALRFLNCPRTVAHLWGEFPILESTHHLLPSPHGELAPAIEAVLDMYGTNVTVVVAHNGQGAVFLCQGQLYVPDVVLRGDPTGS